MEVYEIRVKGHLAPGWADWLGGLAIRHLQDGETLLCGPLPDQAALRSVLIHIWDLNLEVTARTRRRT